MLSEMIIKREIANGMSAVCAWCEHHWSALKEGRTPGCQQHDCGGPLKGLAFPRYKGPRPHLASYCFICGTDADMAVEFTGRGSVGCCKGHESSLRKMIARDGQAVVVNERLVPVVSTPAVS
jgi:hypothetical protein